MFYLKLCDQIHKEDSFQQLTLKTRRFTANGVCKCCSIVFAFFCVAVFSAYFLYIYKYMLLAKPLISFILQ